MKDKDKTREQLLEGLKALQGRLAKLEGAETERKRAEEELHLLQSINNAMNIGTPMDNVLQMTADGIREVFDYAASDIYILDEKKRELVYTAISVESNILKQIEKLTGLTVKGHRIPLSKGSSFYFTLPIGGGE